MVLLDETMAVYLTNYATGIKDAGIPGPTMIINDDEVGGMIIVDGQGGDTEVVVVTE
jgi:hypothetical protein